MDTIFGKCCLLDWPYVSFIHKHSRPTRLSDEDFLRRLALTNISGPGRSVRAAARKIIWCTGKKSSMSFQQTYSCCPWIFHWQRHWRETKKPYFWNFKMFPWKLRKLFLVPRRLHHVRLGAVSVQLSELPDSLLSSRCGSFKRELWKWKISLSWRWREGEISPVVPFVDFQVDHYVICLLINNDFVCLPTA